MQARNEADACCWGCKSKRTTVHMVCTGLQPTDLCSGLSSLLSVTPGWGGWRSTACAGQLTECSMTQCSMCTLHNFACNQYIDLANKRNTRTMCSMSCTATCSSRKSNKQSCILCQAPTSNHRPLQHTRYHLRSRLPMLLSQTRHKLALRATYTSAVKAMQSDTACSLLGLMLVLGRCIMPPLAEGFC